MLRLALVSNALLQWADATTTVFFLHLGAQEGNPVMAQLLETAGIGAFLLLKIGIALALLGFLPIAARFQGRQRRRAVQATGAFAFLMVLVVANNVALLTTL